MSESYEYLFLLMNTKNKFFQDPDSLGAHVKLIEVEELFEDSD